MSLVHIIRPKNSPTSRKNASRKNPISNVFQVNFPWLREIYENWQAFPEQIIQKDVLGVAFAPMNFPIRKTAATCENHRILASAVFR